MLDVNANLFFDHPPVELSRGNGLLRCDNVEQLFLSRLTSL